MAVKVGINGFGRIGRNVLRAALGNPEIDFVAVNDLTSPATLAHLLKYDSILGNLKNEITAGDDFISVDGKKIKVWAERDPAKLDWASVGAQIVIESTGRFTDAKEAGKQIKTDGRRESEESISTMENRGLKINHLSDSALKEWESSVQTVYPKIRGTIVPADVFDEVMSQLKAYRAAHEGTKP